MKFLLLLMAATIIVVLFTLIVMAYLSAREEDTYQPVGPEPDDIDIKPNYARCTIRSDREPRRQSSDRDWHNVRIQFYLPDARQPVRVFNFDRWSADRLYGFEDRLVTAGFRRTAAGNSQQVPIGFDELQRFVVFTREPVRSES